MKLNKFMLGAVLSMTMSTSVAFAQSVTPESVDLAVIIEQSELTPEELVAQLIAQYPEMAAAIVQSVITANPESAQTVVVAAITAEPEQAASIATVATEAGVSNQVVTTAALQAGIDPTEVQQETAVGEESPTAVAPAPAQPAPVKKFPGAEPTKPVKEAPVSGN
ncbi:hypothetical protein [Vibrio coralliirubri]|uniref:hypothetical protein n=1 Tax=Vibrio coralliirubri TaxID=1516159 RepID=UPI000EFC641E|nr:hypothetical protein [Vibrio coralliirubri]